MSLPPPADAGNTNKTKSAPAAAYPVRSNHFDRTFLRLVMDANAVNDIGADGVLLLIAVVQFEDKSHYRGAVEFWNGHLMKVAGIKSDDTLVRVRKRCIDTGWLYYLPGTRTKPGRYWVTVPECKPALATLDDPHGCGASNSDGAVTIRTDAECQLDDPQPCGASAGDDPHRCGVSARRSADDPHGCGASTLDDPHRCGTFLPKYTPIPKDKNPPTPVPGELASTTPAPKTLTKSKPNRECKALFDRFWAEYPRKVAKAKAVQAFAKLAPDEALVNAMFAALAWQKRLETWAKDNGQFIPHPATWLNQRRWEDENPNPTSTTNAKSQTGPRAAIVGSGHRVDSEPGKWAAPANEFGRQTRLPRAPNSGSSEPPSKPGGAEPGPPAAAA